MKLRSKSLNGINQKHGDCFEKQIIIKKMKIYNVFLIHSLLVMNGTDNHLIENIEEVKDKKRIQSNIYP